MTNACVLHQVLLLILPLYCAGSTWRVQGQARLDIIQNVQFKFVELLSLPFSRSTEEATRQSITYRYAKVKAQASVVQAKLQVRWRPNGARAHSEVQGSSARRG